jgi:hypothetical protein
VSRKKCFIAVPGYLVGGVEKKFPPGGCHGQGENITV